MNSYYDEGWMDGWDSLETKLEQLVDDLKDEGKHEIASRIYAIYNYIESNEEIENA